MGQGKFAVKQRDFSKYDIMPVPYDMEATSRNVTVVLILVTI